ncbi:hypothetical protein [Oenococcus oeni]|nr:hypothetical protein [Oenococcus oeni]CAD19133.1 hypothetical protein [Oenococcus phage fOg44]EKP90724.1 putative phage protein [Oenococcus oeni AWRIB202]OIK70669.1 hypothetical protein ATW70_10360 [Oenococcus oeni]OIK77797.1 hypothetical protein ATW74_10150 [Oenococcus oeni]OIK89965.1 hypothetical protein ATW83_10710 [Oenococcus oeni]
MKLIAFIVAITLLVVAFNLRRKPKVSNSTINELNKDTEYQIPQEVIDAMNVIKRQRKSELRRMHRKSVHK